MFYIIFYSNKLLTNLTCRVSKTSIKISYYSQRDSLCQLLTVEESLMYASMLRNCIKSARKKNPLFTDINANEFTSIGGGGGDGKENNYHRLIVNKLVEELNLQKCLKVRVSQCSGGQKRRLSIALELIFSPTIFLLDEPTSGLDSLSSLQCIMMLKKLVTNSHRPMVIATSIHQPTAKIMSYFDQAYIISYNGQCIYNGPTKNLVSTLSNFGLHCPQYHNPADYVVEIATGDFGNESIDLLANHFKAVCEEPSSLDRTISITKILQETKRHSLYKQILTTWVLTKRCMLTNLRDPNIYIARLVTILSTLVLIGILYRDEKIGELDGCINRPTMNTLEKLKQFEFFSAENTYYANFGFLFYSVILMVFMSILPTLLSFPLEVSVFIKENFNGWYSLKSYYIARNIADFPPIIFFPILYGAFAFVLTHQLFEAWRFFVYLSILIFEAFLGQGVGFLVSAFFVNDVTSSTVVGAILNIPLFLFTGLLIKISAMPKYFQPITYLSYFRLAFESLLVTIYGMGRCDTAEPITLDYLKQEFGYNVIDMVMCVNELSPALSDNMTELLDSYNDKFLHSVNETSSSLALNSFNYTDDVLINNMIAMAAYVCILRIGAYLVLRHKTMIK